MDDQLNNLPCGFITLTDTGIVKSANKTFLEMLNYNRGEIIDQHIESIMSISNKFFFHTYFYPFIRLYGNVEEMFLSLKSNNGEDCPILLYGKRRIQDNEELIDCICVHIPKRAEYEKEIRNISVQIEDAYRDKKEATAKLNTLLDEIELKNEELIMMNEQLEMMTLTDNLTGLRNRQFFQMSLSTSIINFKELNTPFSLVIIDIDYFKKVNDTWGHIVGDRVLIKLAEVMKNLYSEHDIVRYGGEEFIAILNGIGFEESIEKAEALRAAVENNDWGKCPITVSIGIDTFTAEHNEQSIIAHADRALYASKNNGRNCVTHAKELY